MASRPSCSVDVSAADHRTHYTGSNQDYDEYCQDDQKTKIGTRKVAHIHVFGSTDSKDD